MSIAFGPQIPPIPDMIFHTLQARLRPNIESLPHFIVSGSYMCRSSVIFG